MMLNSRSRSGNRDFDQKVGYVTEGYENGN